MKAVDVVITIPAFNEQDMIGAVIDEVVAVMDRERYRYVIHVVNDGSTDATAQIAAQHGAHVFSNSRNLGLAETFKKEIAHALAVQPRVIVHTDADNQYPASYIPYLIKKVEEGNHLVLGSRFLGGKRHISLLKYWGNRAFAFIFSKLCKQRLTDTTTGFRAFTPEVAREISFTGRFTYTQEQIIRARKLRFKIAEIPIVARPTRESRLFKNVFEYAIKAWITIVRVYRDYEPLKFFGRIGLLLIGAGLMLGSWLTYLVLTSGKVGHIPATVLSGVLIISGIQIILFGFLADMQKR